MGLKYLEGRELDYINKTANAATREAHMAGGVPVLEDCYARYRRALAWWIDLLL